MDDSTHPQQPIDPGKAFDDLKSEVYVLRRAVEDWRDALKKAPVPDYPAHYEKVSKAFNYLTGQLDELKKFPGEAAEAIADAGRGNLDEAKKQLSYASNLADKERESLKTLIGTVRDQRRQRLWLLRTGAAGLVAGMILFYVVARVLPLGLNTYLAAGIMGADRWHAGQTLMQAGNLEGWNLLMADTGVTNANRAKVDACRAAAAKSKKDETCAITVSPGG